MPTNDSFTFEISLSVLNHLGRNLYRSFTTVLGEAISNSWDADAENVWIYVDRENNSFFIKDDGHGMTAGDFQSKFLKIGYSKRIEGTNNSEKGRPFIGRKGIGKLALLSCAEKVSILTKTKEDDAYVGGVIDNSQLDDAIIDDIRPDQYQLGNLTQDLFVDYIEDHNHGTIIYFENIKEGIRNKLMFLRKIIALYFRFSLHDDSFDIYLNDVKIGFTELEQLLGKTEFLWTINDFDDPYISDLKRRFTADDNETRNLDIEGEVTGFIASVEKPRDLAILATDERVGIDLFVNGRLREQNILQHVPTSRITENYLYGQLHYDGLDAGIDRFTTSREGIVTDDPMYNSFLEKLRQDVILKIIEDWDDWRRKHRKPGDSDSEKLTLKERKSEELFNEVSTDFTPPRDSSQHQKVSSWVKDLTDDARYNFSSYAECFVSENLMRMYIEDEQVELSPKTIKRARRFRKQERKNKNRGNISIDIRQKVNDAAYLAMDDLASLVDDCDLIDEANLSRDAKAYKPLRDAVAHTATLTVVAKNQLNSVYENIKGRVKTILGSAK